MADRHDIDENNMSQDIESSIGESLGKGKNIYDKAKKAKDLYDKFQEAKDAYSQKPENEGNGVNDKNTEAHNTSKDKDPDKKETGKDTTKEPDKTKPANDKNKSNALQEKDGFGSKNGNNIAKNGAEKAGNAAEKSAATRGTQAAGGAAASGGAASGAAASGAAAGGGATAAAAAGTAVAPGIGTVAGLAAGKLMPHIKKILIASLVSSMAHIFFFFGIIAALIALPVMLVNYRKEVVEIIDTVIEETVDGHEVAKAVYRGVKAVGGKIIEGFEIIDVELTAFVRNTKDVVEDIGGLFGYTPPPEVNIDIDEEDYIYGYQEPLNEAAKKYNKFFEELDDKIKDNRDSIKKENKLKAIDLFDILPIEDIPDGILLVDTLGYDKSNIADIVAIYNIEKSLYDQHYGEEEYDSVNVDIDENSSERDQILGLLDMEVASDFMPSILNKVFNRMVYCGDPVRITQKSTVTIEKELTVESFIYIEVDDEDIDLEDAWIEDGMLVTVDEHGHETREWLSTTTTEDGTTMYHYGETSEDDTSSTDTENSGAETSSETDPDTESDSESDEESDTKRKLVTEKSHFTHTYEAEIDYCYDVYYLHRLTAYEYMQEYGGEMTSEEYELQSANLALLYGDISASNNDIDMGYFDMDMVGYVNNFLTRDTITMLLGDTYDLTEELLTLGYPVDTPLEIHGSGLTYTAGRCKLTATEVGEYLVTVSAKVTDPETQQEQYKYHATTVKVIDNAIKQLMAFVQKVNDEQWAYTQKHRWDYRSADCSSFVYGAYSYAGDPSGYTVQPKGQPPTTGMGYKVADSSDITAAGEAKFGIANSQIIGIDKDLAARWGVSYDQMSGAKNARSVTAEELLPGDLIFYKITDSKMQEPGYEIYASRFMNICHVAMYVGDQKTYDGYSGKVAHMCASEGDIPGLMITDYETTRETQRVLIIRPFGNK